ncbi:MAG: hypothetical protein EZS28_009848 [Streblomastix strix]|uniref:DDE-1 domain-containing protein n=1 Tax=Streblomastix strix TaxID=222440 RepID=A0A5J4WHU0_9EUKA|nr:MAG: hypothetical protein EZS28_009848 [Streblomastix strix]
MKEEANVKEGDERKYMDTLEQEVVNLPLDVIYCTDESRIQFFVDARSKKIVVRRNDDANEMIIPINRNEPQKSLLGAISLSCEAIPPLLILKGTQWDDKRIPSDVTAARERLGTPHMPGVLLCDNHSTHCGEYTCQFLANNNIKLITIPLHSSKFLQVFDVVSFGNLMRQINKTRDIQGDLPLYDTIRHAIKAYGAATTFPNCRVSFSGAGLIQNPGTMRAKAHVIPDFLIV